MSKQTKLFVIDTNVVMHDPTCFFQFEEHHVFLPMCVLEELDEHKKGMSEVSRNVRQAMRTLDELVRGLKKDSLVKGVALPKQGTKLPGRLFFQSENDVGELPGSLVRGKVDNAILEIVLAEQKKRGNQSVILVTKDINMRIKATMLGIVTEDYTTDRVSGDIDVLYSGIHKLSADEFTELVVVSTNVRDELHTALHGTLVKSLHQNEFLVVEDSSGHSSIYCVKSAEGKGAVVRKVTAYQSPNHKVYGIQAKNTEQSCALNLLMNPEIDLVTLLGPAGTGKTLLTLAAALEQCTEKEKRYEEIIVTRATIPLGEDIGFLPGTEEEKMGPWFGALEDNMRVLIKDPPTYDRPIMHGNHTSDWAKRATQDFLGKYIKVKNMGYMRGRTFQNKFLIIDEAQNLTSKQMKALITRAGPGTKVVCMGNVSQIDHPYLTEGTSGLTNTVLRFRGWSRFGSVLLTQGERSPLADHANEVM